MSHPLLQFFVFECLPNNVPSAAAPGEVVKMPEPFGAVARAFRGLAHDVDMHLPSNAEKTVALRKLLEAKEAAVRALLYREGGDR